MSQHTRRLTSRLPSPALVVAVCAMLVAVCGTSYALAALPKKSVGAAQLKKNAVKSKAVKNNSLRAKDFRTGELPPSEVLIKNSGGIGTTITALFGAGADTLIQSMSLPAGTYYVRANVVGINQHAALQGELRCFLHSSGEILVNGTSGLYVPMEPNAGTNNSRGFFTLDAAYRLAAAGTVSVGCSEEAAAQTMSASASMTALRTAQVTAVP